MRVKFCFKLWCKFIWLKPRPSNLQCVYIFPIYGGNYAAILFSVHVTLSVTFRPWTLNFSLSRQVACRLLSAYKISLCGRTPVHRSPLLLSKNCHSGWFLVVYGDLSSMDSNVYFGDISGSQTVFRRTLEFNEEFASNLRKTYRNFP